MRAYRRVLVPNLRKSSCVRRPEIVSRLQVPSTESRLYPVAQESARYPFGRACLDRCLSFRIVSPNFLVSAFALFFGGSFQESG